MPVALNVIRACRIVAVICSQVITSATAERWVVISSDFGDLPRFSMILIESDFVHSGILIDNHRSPLWLAGLNGRLAGKPEGIYFVAICIPN